MKVGTAALCGLVFALFSLLGMALGLPLLEHYRSRGGQVTENSEANLSVKADDAAQTDTEATEAEESREENSTEGTEAALDGEGTSSDSSTGSAAGSDVQEAGAAEAPVTYVTQVSLTLEDYQELRSELYAIGKNFGQSVVAIASITDETDWLNNHYELKNTEYGLIISETETTLLILTQQASLPDESRIVVTLEGGFQCEAQLITEDCNTGMAILSIDKDVIDPGTRGRIAIAQLGNSHRVRQGQIVLAIGNPLGGGRAILIGNVVGTGGELVYRDRNYATLETDIVGMKNSSYILINTDGEVIGLGMAGQEDTKLGLNSLGITDAEGLLQLLINGNEIPYAGLYLTNVTRAIEEEYGIPTGVYIREVVMDSPAMLAGLQSGDVITAVSGMPVNTDAGFQQLLFSCKVGDSCQITVKRPGQDGYDEIICEMTVGVMTE